MFYARGDMKFKRARSQLEPRLYQASSSFDDIRGSLLDHKEASRTVGPEHRTTFVYQ